MNDDGTISNFEEIMAKSGKTELQRLANQAVFSGDKKEQVKAAEMLLDQANEATYWLNQVLNRGILDIHITHAVAWPVFISLQSKDAYYHKTVVDEMKWRKLGSRAPIGRPNKSGGKQKPSAAVDAARLIHGIIVNVHRLEEEPQEKLEGWVYGEKWAFSCSDGYISYATKMLALDPVARPLFKLIRRQKSVKPSAQRWNQVGQPILLYLRSDLEPAPKGRSKSKPSEEQVKRNKSNRQLRTAIRNAYIDLANVRDKSRNFKDRPSV